MYKETRLLNLDTQVEAILYLLYDEIVFNRTASTELYLVGGCVRDLLLGQEPKDYDLCTNLTPEEVKNSIKHKRWSVWDSGIKHGTVTVVDTYTKMSFEITTYRQDGKYSDGRHPDSVNFTTSLEEDLKRRDFTINSFAYDFRAHILCMLDSSYLKDLENGVIRCVGDATARFSEDALRILRAFRFAAQKGFILNTATYEAAKACAPLLEKISKERIRDELTKLLLSDNPRLLELLICAGVEPYIFNSRTPITDMINCPHQNPWHYTDVFHHTLDVIERVPATFELRWAALFHDIAKPIVKKPRPKGPEGHYVYYGHPEVSAQIAEEIMQMLKFSTSQICKITKFVRYHDEELATCKMSTFKRVLTDIGPENFLEFMKLRIADSSAHSVILDVKYAIGAINTCYERYQEVIEKQMPLEVKDLKINGYDLLEQHLEGREVGDCLQWLLRIVLDEPAYNTKEKLLALVQTYKEMMFQSS